MTSLDKTDLEARIKDMYREVANRPGQAFHFETGRALALRLGYLSEWLESIPAAAIWFFNSSRP